MRRAAFLRSINVGGRRVKNAELIAVFEGLGLQDVGAYQAAGNLVFSGELSAEALREGLKTALGFDVPVLLRSFEDLVRIAARTPFDPEELAQGGKPQVIFLDAPGGAVDDLETPVDRLRLVGTELHWLPVAGVSGTQLDVKALERRLGLQTCRTQGTLQRMVKKFGGGA